MVVAKHSTKEERRGKAKPAEPEVIQLVEALLASDYVEHPCIGLVREWALSTERVSRYCVAHDGRVDKIVSAIKTGIDMRTEFDAWYTPEELDKKINSVEVDLRQGRFFQRGRDSDGHLLIYQRSRVTDFTLDDDHTRLCVMMWTLDACERKIEADPTLAPQWVLVFDQAGTPIKGKPTAASTVKLAQIVMHIFPERLAAVYIVDPGFLIKVIVKLVRTVVDSRTGSRLHSRNREGVTVGRVDGLTDRCAAAQLPYEYGGEDRFEFDGSAHWRGALLGLDDKDLEGASRVVTRENGVS